MIDIVINYWAVLVSGVAQMALGSLWWSPMMFGKSWMKLSGLNEAVVKATSRSKMVRLYTVNLASALLMAYVLAHFVAYTNSTTVFTGARTGFWIWLGFIFTTTLGDYLFSGRSLKLHAINYGFYLIGLVGMGMILAVWH